MQEGRRLLKRGKADQALGQLQTALSLYTAANNRKGIAAAQNELGDLYLRQGQNKTALEHYQQAYDALTGVLVREQKDAAAAGTAARMVPSTKAGEAVDTAASASEPGSTRNCCSPRSVTPIISSAKCAPRRPRMD